MRYTHINCVMRKPKFAYGKNKGADQLCSNCTADLTAPLFMLHG